ncbi:hypothetical protein K9N68_12405 [Kovacikia minuta CCNUW1]|uniref:hypothetical protein n=1 Tax=Kovacikia minuta TaxID=2931930 RepID=UPI001CCDC5A2|nr:hypothetical protein [Kovacikia minuta]UBF28602.1 hypothetical protein K9N68_12405 [Kovacikia minuta CCNUW1]
MNEKPESSLLVRSQETFSELNPAEKKLLCEIARGCAIDYRAECEKNEDDTLKNAPDPDWGVDRTLRANLIRWLCLDSEIGTLPA